MRAKRPARRGEELDGQGPQFLGLVLEQIGIVVPIAHAKPHRFHRRLGAGKIARQFEAGVHVHLRDVDQLPVDGNGGRDRRLQRLLERVHRQYHRARFRQPLVGLHGIDQNWRRFRRLRLDTHGSLADLGCGNGLLRFLGLRLGLRFLRLRRLRASGHDLPRCVEGRA